MSSATLSSTIRERVNEQWPLVYSGVPIGWSNEEFTPPAVNLSTGAGPYILIDVQDGRRESAAEGSSPTYLLTMPAIYHRIFVPTGWGDGLARRYADALWEIYQTAGFAWITFPADASEFRHIGREGAYWHSNYTVWGEYAEYYSPGHEPVVMTDAYVIPVTTATAHGLTEGQLVYQDAGAGSGWSLAVATAQATLATGIVSTVSNTLNFAVTLLGRVHRAAHGLGAKGTPIYTSDATAGLLTATAPTTTNRWKQKVGEVYDANTILFMRETPERL